MASIRQHLPCGRQWGVLATVLLMYFFAPTFSSVVSTFALIPDHYGIAPAAVSWISSLANPTACIAGLVIGTLAGRRLSYRMCAFAAMLLFTVFGALPFFWRAIPFWALLASRALFGLGVGCINPLVQAILTRMFRTETARAAWIGAGQIVFSIGASVGRIAAGALSLDGSWQAAYAFYLLALAPMVMVLLFVRDDLVEGGSAEAPADTASAAPAPDSDAEAAAAAGRTARRIPAAAAAFIVVFGFSTLISSTFFNYAGIAMAENGFDTLLVGTVLAVFNITGVFISAANVFMWRVFRLWNLPIAFALLAAAYALCLAGYATGSTAAWVAASGVIGVGCCLAALVMPMAMSTFCSSASLTLAIGLQEVSRNLGSFLSSPWLEAVGRLLGDAPVPQFTAILALSCAVTVVAVVVAALFNKRFPAA